MIGSGEKKMLADRLKLLLLASLFVLCILSFLVTVESNDAQQGAVTQSGIGFFFFLLLSSFFHALSLKPRKHAQEDLFAVGNGL